MAVLKFVFIKKHRHKSLIGLILSLMLISCSASTNLQKSFQHRNFSPIPVANSAPVSFHRVIFRIPRGKEIGHHYEGLPRVRQSDYSWDAGLAIGPNEFKINANKELTNYGYTVPTKENLLFGFEQTQKARYLISAEISDVVVNTYAPSAGDFSEASVNIHWQLYDTFTKEILLNYHDTGYAKNSNDIGVIVDAFINSLHRIMTVDDFISLLRREKKSTNKKRSDYDKLLINNKTQNHKLPEEVNAVNRGVVTISSGSYHGSGFFIGSSGYLITAAHVVSGYDTVQVITNDGSVIPANIKRIYLKSDVALLKVEEFSSNYNTLPVRKNKHQGIIDVYAIGTPINKSFSHSLSKGIISSYRIINDIPFIQTDTPINPGNSGGPLLNKDGQVIGIVSWKYSNRFGYEGLSFCVDINYALEVLNVAIN